MLGAFAAAIALSSASPARAQGAPTTRNGTLPHLAGAAPDGPSRCAFPFIVDADNLNLAYPDPNATYWAMPFTLGAGDSMLVHGTYPSARFMAVTLYDLGGDTIAQLMHFDYFPTAEDVFKAFDFTVVMGALDMDAGVIDQVLDER